MLSLTAVGPLPEARVGRGGTIGADMVVVYRRTISEDCAVVGSVEKTVAARQYGQSRSCTAKPRIRGRRRAGAEE